MSRTARSPRSRTWLRMLALLLALWVPGAHVQAQAAPALGAAAETFEHDVLGTLVRPCARAVHRADVPERPAPLSAPASPARPAPRPCSTTPREPYAPALLRTVVLRC
ncbi:hypothetical protein ACIHEJ_36815 [Streptomyces sp. NPDC052301]|uniref:hypothetical protein n=1 Tax=Streptomyces sp. NPDC052301 TaxID=3365687 RepID=UPI0037D8722C